MERQYLQAYGFRIDMVPYASVNSGIYCLDATNLAFIHQALSWDVVLLGLAETNFTF